MLRALPLLLVAVLPAGCSLPEAPPLRPAETRPAGSAEVSGGLPVPTDAQTAVVVSVTDGDTVRLRGRGTGPVPGESTRVRILLVDTPEVHQEVECFGPEASARAEQLVPPGSTVRVQADADAEDRFGRLLLHVWNAEGVNLGEALVAEGYATVRQIDPNRRYLEQFEAREQEARRAGRGLWSAC
ncbi:MAG TPA: thermonuclease family protein [Mycobacteriales bacterium]|nr:thermonuclease family protein [Mycobacteriales bacterium]